MERWPEYSGCGKIVSPGAEDARMEEEDLIIDSSSNHDSDTDSVFSGFNSEDDISVMRLKTLKYERSPEDNMHSKIKARTRRKAALKRTQTSTEVTENFFQDTQVSQILSCREQDGKHNLNDDDKYFASFASKAYSELSSRESDDRCKISVEEIEAVDIAESEKIDGFKDCIVHHIDANLPVYNVPTCVSSSSSVKRSDHKRNFSLYQRKNGKRICISTSSINHQNSRYVFSQQGKPSCIQKDHSYAVPVRVIKDATVMNQNHQNISKICANYTLMSENMNSLDDRIDVYPERVGSVESCVVLSMDEVEYSSETCSVHDSRAVINLEVKKGSFGYIARNKINRKRPSKRSLTYHSESKISCVLESSKCVNTVSKASDCSLLTGVAIASLPQALFNRKNCTANVADITENNVAPVPVPIQNINESSTYKNLQRDVIKVKEIIPIYDQNISASDCNESILKEVDKDTLHTQSALVETNNNYICDSLKSGYSKDSAQKNPEHRVTRRSMLGVKLEQSLDTNGSPPCSRKTDMGLLEDDDQDMLDMTDNMGCMQDERHAQGMLDKTDSMETMQDEEHHEQGILDKTDSMESMQDEERHEQGILDKTDIMESMQDEERHEQGILDKTDNMKSMQDEERYEQGILNKTDIMASMQDEEHHEQGMLDKTDSMKSMQDEESYEQGMLDNMDRMESMQDEHHEQGILDMMDSRSMKSTQDEKRHEQGILDKKDSMESRQDEEHHEQAILDKTDSIESRQNEECHEPGILDKTDCSIDIMQAEEYHKQDILNKTDSLESMQDEENPSFAAYLGAYYPDMDFDNPSEKLDMKLIKKNAKPLIRTLSAARETDEVVIRGAWHVLISQCPEGVHKSTLNSPRANIRRSLRRINASGERKPYTKSADEKRKPYRPTKLAYEERMPCARSADEDKLPPCHNDISTEADSASQPFVHNKLSVKDHADAKDSSLILNVGLRKDTSTKSNNDDHIMREAFAKIKANIKSCNANGTRDSKATPSIRCFCKFNSVIPKEDRVRHCCGKSDRKNSRTTNKVINGAQGYSYPTNRTAFFSALGLMEKNDYDKEVYAQSLIVHKTRKVCANKVKDTDHSRALSDGVLEGDALVVSTNDFEGFALQEMSSQTLLKKPNDEKDMDCKPSIDLPLRKKSDRISLRNSGKIAKKSSCLCCANDTLNNNWYLGKSSTSIYTKLHREMTPQEDVHCVCHKYAIYTPKMNPVSGNFSKLYSHSHNCPLSKVNTQRRELKSLTPVHRPEKHIDSDVMPIESEDKYKNVIRECRVSISALDFKQQDVDKCSVFLKGDLSPISSPSKQNGSLAGGMRSTNKCKLIASPSLTRIEYSPIYKEQYPFQNKILSWPSRKFQEFKACMSHLATKPVQCDNFDFLGFDSARKYLSPSCHTTNHQKSAGNIRARSSNLTSTLEHERLPYPAYNCAVSIIDYCNCIASGHQSCIFPPEDSKLCFNNFNIKKSSTFNNFIITDKPLNCGKGPSVGMDTPMQIPSTGNVETTYIEGKEAPSEIQQHCKQVENHKYISVDSVNGCQVKLSQNSGSSEKSVSNDNYKCSLLSRYGRRSYACGICSHKCSSSGDLVRHLRNHTDERPLKCHKCPSTFKYKSTLNRHLEIHEGKKPYTCLYCGVGFTQKVHLQSHVRIHSGEKPFMCEECGKTFARPDHLRVHTSTHSEVRPYKCKVCPLAFKCHSYLKGHVRIHLRDKRYQCKYCTASFLVAHSLKLHMRTHTGEKPVHCTLCNIDFRYESSLRRHFKTKHPDIKGDKALLIQNVKA